MTSARKRFTNAQNSRKCTGPKTAAGKARSAQNARRHGLNLPVLADSVHAPDVAGLARRIVASVCGADDDPRRFELACRIAEAQIDLKRARLLSLPLAEQIERDPKAASAVVPEMLRIDRYVRRATSRRKFAIREFDAAVTADVLAKRNQSGKAK